MSTNTTFERLFQDCTVRNDDRSWAILDVYVAIMRIHTRLENELNDLNISLPVDADPIPDGRLRELFDGDPNGNPVKFLPTKSGRDDSQRIATADKLHSALRKIAEELEVEVNSMKTRSGKG